MKVWSCSLFLYKKLKTRRQGKILGISFTLKYFQPCEETSEFSRRNGACRLSPRRHNSDGDPAEDFTDIQKQVETILSFSCESLVLELGVSGTTDLDRPGIDLLLKKFQMKPGSFFYMKNVTRLSRTPSTCFIDQLAQSEVYFQTDDFSTQLTPGMDTFELRRRIEQGCLKEKKKAQKLGILRAKSLDPSKYKMPTKANVDLLKKLKNGLELKKTKTFLARELNISRASLNNYIKKFESLKDYR